MKIKRKSLEERIASACEKFSGGYNCAQSVLISFSDLLGKEEQDLKQIAAGFCGGMGKLQLTCGAATGAFMAFSMYASIHSETDEGAKELSAAMIRAFERQYVALTGSLTCRMILGVDMNTVEGLKVAREKDLFGTVCVDAVVNAVEIADRVIKKCEAQGYVI
jgi:C_GCAxxG_C_C family probable redox protein